MFRQKTLLPDPAPDFVARADLAAKSDPLRRRLTVFQVPGGFGKTTLMADACHRCRRAGHAVAWLSLGEDDDSAELVRYLAVAFADAGLEIPETPVPESRFEGDEYRLSLLLHSIERHAAPCLLALDEVDRLRNREARNMVDRILRQCPANLHLLLACRQPPSDVDLASPLVEGRGVWITVDDLRFQRSDIARFFGTRLSRRELAAVDESSQGWPIALRIQRNEGLALERTQAVAENWIESRLWRDQSAADRTLVLDLGLFDWIDATLVDEVLAPATLARVRRLPSLVGLLQSIGGSADEMYMHPLLRQYCRDLRLRETPDRYRSLHQTIARALAKRGHLVYALRHARDAGDDDLFDQLVEDAGGARAWLQSGVALLRSVDVLLTTQLVYNYPRLGLIRLLALTMSGQLSQANALYVELAVRSDGFRRNVGTGSDLDLEVDELVYRYLMASCGCHSIGGQTFRTMMARIAELMRQGDVHPVTRSLAAYATVQVAMMVGDFAIKPAVRDEWLRLPVQSRYMSMYVALNAGVAAMAQGRVDEAEREYAGAYRTAKNENLDDVGAALMSRVLTGELHLERGRDAASAIHWSPQVLGLVAEGGAWIDIYAALAEAEQEFAIRQAGFDEGLRRAEDMVAYANRSVRPALLRCLLAMRARLLVLTGRLQDAHRSWRDNRLPERVADIVDLENQGWREMEMIGTARLALLIGRAATDRAARAEAEELTAALLAKAAQRNLVRTRLRVLALAMAAAHRDGQAERAQAHLVDYLRAFAAADYSRALGWDPVPALAVLDGAEAAERIDGDLQDAARLLRDRLRSAPCGHREQPPKPQLTARQLAILERLAHSRDKVIANALNLSVDGVRYHVKRIFKELEVTDRAAAVRRARALGILDAPPD